jgi:hypothetical protein
MRHAIWNHQHAISTSPATSLSLSLLLSFFHAFDDCHPHSFCAFSEERSAPIVCCERTLELRLCMRASSCHTANKKHAGYYTNLTPENHTEKYHL